MRPALGKLAIWALLGAASWTVIVILFVAAFGYFGVGA